MLFLVYFRCAHDIGEVGVGYTEDDRMFGGYDGDKTPTCWGHYEYGVRPVVILKSNLTSKDLHKIDSIEEEQWKYTYVNMEI